MAKLTEDRPPRCRKALTAHDSRPDEPDRAVSVADLGGWLTIYQLSQVWAALAGVGAVPLGPLLPDREGTRRRAPALYD